MSPSTGMDKALPVTVVAAGALCWRVRNSELEVLVIHRPQYQDWSWPKGKLDDGETVPEAAAREVREEVGLRIKLGIPLPDIVYPVNSGSKRVHYWAAHVDKHEPEPDGNEVDRANWVHPAQAEALLTNPSDIEPLQALVRAHESDQLETWPIILLRHAKAKPRSSWTLAEGDRTLVASGQRQAKAVARLLMAWSPKRALTSPWVRCVQTLKPYGKGHKLKVKQVEALTEATHKRSAKKAAAVAESALERGKPVIICTHRPVLPTLLKALTVHMSEEQICLLPSSDPYLSPGEILVLHVSRRSTEHIVAVEQFKPFDD